MYLDPRLLSTRTRASSRSRVSIPLRTLSSTTESVLLTSTRYVLFTSWCYTWCQSFYRLRPWRTVLTTAAFGERLQRLTETTELSACSSATTSLLSLWERLSASCSTPAVCNWMKMATPDQDCYTFPFLFQQTIHVHKYTLVLITLHESCRLFQDFTGMSLDKLLNVVRTLKVGWLFGIERFAITCDQV